MTATPTTAIRSGITAALAAMLGVAILPGIAHADETRDKQWALEELDIAEAHEETQGAGVTIGMVDSGVDAEHPDLKGNIKPGLSTWDDSKGLKDTLGHGTAMASDLVAHGHGTHNSQGILGVAPEAEVLPVAVYPPEYKDKPNSVGNEVTDGMVEGIRWLADQDVDVILVASTGLDTSNSPLAKAVNYAVDDNEVPVVAGAGNQDDSKAGKETLVGAPAIFDNTIGVNGTGKNGKLWEGSVAPKGPGDGNITVAAPAQDIVNAKVGGGYETGSGTSDASAIAAGVVALMKAQWPDMGWKDIHWRLTETAEDLGEKGYDYKFGNGLINPVDALTAHVDPPANIDDEQINPPVNPKASPKPSKDESKKDTTLEADTGTNTWLFIAIAAAVVLVLGAVVVAVLIRKRHKTSALP